MQSREEAAKPVSGLTCKVPSGLFFRVCFRPANVALRMAHTAVVHVTGNGNSVVRLVLNADVQVPSGMLMRNLGRSKGSPPL